MCFSVVAGKYTTIDSNTMLGVNNDWTGYPGSIHHVAQKNHGKNATHTLISGKKIPNVETTYAYTHTTTAYDTGTLKNESWWGGVNENKVAIGMQGVYSFVDTEESEASLQSDDIPVLLLQRAQNARDGIQMVGELIEQYGFTTSSVEGGEGVSTISVVDPDEGFFLEIAPGGYWVAKRVEDDEVEFRVNSFGIQEVDFQDEKRYLYSDSLKEKAIEEDLYDQEKTFNFYEIFSEEFSVSEYYGVAGAPENAIRKWHTINFMSGEDIPLDEMRYTVKPNRKLTPRDFMDLLSLSSEDTKYDLSEEPEAGPHKNPFWMEVSTSVGQAGTVFSSVFQLRRDLPSEIGIVSWFGLANSHLSPFIPHYFGSEGLPKAFEIGEMAEYNPNSAWWMFQEVGQLSYRNYQTIAKELVIPAFTEMENTNIANQTTMDQLFMALYEEDQKLFKQSIRQYTHAQASLGLEKARELSQEIKSRFLANTYIDF
jgi:dipeptidase